MNLGTRNSVDEHWNLSTIQFQEVIVKHTNNYLKKLLHQGLNITVRK